MTTLAVHSFDVLENIAVFRKRCPVCGHEIHESLTDDHKAGWFECDCGHITEIENRVRWN